MTPITPRSNPHSWSKSFWVMAGLCGGLASSLVAPIAWARPVLNDTSHFLLAQQVVDGLPPPPPVLFGQELPSQPQQYLVVVSGDADVMLAQVQQIHPLASVQEYNGQRFIQAGLFGDLNSAQQQVSTLASSGIGAQVVAVTSASSTVSQAPANGLSTQTLPPPELLPTTTVPSSPGGVEFGTSDSAPQADPAATSSGRAYYVIIPGSGNSLDAITDQVIRLTDGMGIDGMVEPGTSHGPHVRVGPFNSRSAASRWTRYFRDFGMDARVSYGRSGS